MAYVRAGPSVHAAPSAPGMRTWRPCMEYVHVVLFSPTTTCMADVWPIRWAWAIHLCPSKTHTPPPQQPCMVLLTEASCQQTMHACEVKGKSSVQVPVSQKTTHNITLDTDGACPWIESSSSNTTHACVVHALLYLTNSNLFPLRHLISLANGTYRRASNPSATDKGYSKKGPAFCLPTASSVRAANCAPKASYMHGYWHVLYTCNASFLPIGWMAKVDTIPITCVWSVT